MSTNRKLRDMAKMLPPLPKMGVNGKPIFMTEKMVLFGSEILKDNPEATIEGRDIDPKERYTQWHKKPIMENHEKKLIDVKRKFGIEGLRAYVSLCYSFNNLETPTEVFEGIN